MKRNQIFMLLYLCFGFILCANAEIPQLKKNQYGATQLIVDGKPFLMLAGEVFNSSGSDIPYMEKTLKALHESNLNSVLVSVSWELIEPTEGSFDFTSIDELIRVARENKMKLGILWFGSWKNGLSPYAPDWVLSDTKRFSRVKNDKGENTYTLTPLCIETRNADAKAYSELMKHIAKVDRNENTILVMQVENEVGTLGQTRDFSKEANEAIAGQVPEELMYYLLKNKNLLEIELKTAWEKNGFKTKGTWAEVFGKTDETDLFFMAWNYSLFVNAVASSGKKDYNIPMYCNCWMPNPRPAPGKPGNYPSGGPILTVHDIWKAGAPAIDMLAPDLYGGDFKDEARYFHRANNPLFIPETRTTDGPGTYAFAQEDAICFSPFGIDNQGPEMIKEYDLLNRLMPVITQYQGSGKMSGFFKSGNDTIGRDIKLNNDVTVSVKFQRPRRFGPAAEEKDFRGRPKVPASYGLFIQTGENEFIVAGLNLSVSTFSTNKTKNVWLKDAWEGTYEKGVWKPIVLNNGDEAGFLSSGDPVYNINTFRTNPSEPAIFHFRALTYDRE